MTNKIREKGNYNCMEAKKHNINKNEVNKMKKIKSETMKKPNPLVWIVDNSVKQPKKTLLIFGLVVAFFLILFFQLKFDTSYENVIGDDGPDGMIQHQDLVEQFGEQEIATVVVDCSDSNQSNAESFVNEIATRLKNNKYFRDIDYLANLDIQNEKIPLFLPEESLNFLLDPNATIDSIEENYTSQINFFNTPRFIVSENGKIYLINMIVSENLQSAEGRNKVFNNLSDTIDEVKDSDPNYQKLDVGMTGGLGMSDYEGDRMANDDMIITAVITFFAILIILYFTLRSISLPLMSLIALICGIIITGGIIYLIYGYLNLMATVFIVLILGLGIDFSIHLLARFLEEHGKGSDIQKAFNRTSKQAGKAIFLGTITTATAFGALMFSRLQGLHQMGIILAIGLIVAMVCVFIVLPALITLRLRAGKLEKKLRRDSSFQPTKAIGRISTQHAGIVIIIFIIISVLFAITAPQAELSSDMSEFTPTDVPSYRQLQKVKSNFNYTEDFLMCTVDDYQTLRENVAKFRNINEVMQVSSILDFMPKNQEDNQALFNQTIEKNPELSSVTWLNVKAMEWTDLPEDVRKEWVDENNDKTIFLIRIYAKGNLWSEVYRSDLLTELRDVNPIIIGTAIYWADFMDMIVEDVTKVTIYAVIPIFLIVYLGLGKRNPIYAIIGLVPVAFGVVGVFALSMVFNVTLSVGSIMMIPLVVGIGIDDGVHILHRYLDEGKGSMPSIIQNTGKAIFLTTVTTCLAFGTFLFAAHPGMRSLGPVPVLGIALCFIASIFLLPAILSLMDRRNDKIKAN